MIGSHREVSAVEEHRGFIHKKLDIKLLILFVLRRLPAEIDPERLADLVLIDGGITYFDYKDCLSELVQTAQIEEGEDGVRVTAMGEQMPTFAKRVLPTQFKDEATIE